MIRKNPEEGQPIKIAILDTGIDLPEAAKSLYEGRIIECKSWLEGKGDLELEFSKGDRDVDGHGTHAAGLLLKVAQYAHIYVARVFELGHESRGKFATEDTNEYIAKVSHVFQIFHCAYSLNFLGNQICN